MTADWYGSEKNGQKNPDYCQYCYEDGHFTSDVNMEQMIAICLPHMQDSGLDEKAAHTMLQNFLPHLKRWRQKGQNQNQ